MSIVIFSAGEVVSVLCSFDSFDAAYDCIYHRHDIEGNGYHGANGGAYKVNGINYAYKYVGA